MKGSRAQAIKAVLSQRAGDRCEYCHSPRSVTPNHFHIEHIVPRVHGGGDDLANLALACAACNYGKGTNLSGIDPNTAHVVQLFNPRVDDWKAHFELSEARVNGRTPVGRATVAVLRMNDSARVEARRLSIETGRWNG